MSYIGIRKLIIPPSKYAYREWFFDFQEISMIFEEKKVSTNIGKLETYLVPITTGWTPKDNTEWLTRHYLAVKMILTSTLMLTSCDYSINKNIRTTEHYLQYYALLSCLRALLYAYPREKWSEDKLIKASHSKIINSSVNIIKSFSSDYALEIKRYVSMLKSLRELFSYGAPTSGIKIYEKFDSLYLDKTIYHCKVVSELAQMESEILERSIDKNFTGGFSLINEFAHKCFEYEVNDEIILDDEDFYRIGYYYRKWPRPTNLLNMVSEGHVEDFFGAWCANEIEAEDQYDPDVDWRLIFPFP